MRLNGWFGQGVLCIWLRVWHCTEMLGTLREIRTTGVSVDVRQVSGNNSSGRTTGPTDRHTADVGTHCITALRRGSLACRYLLCRVHAAVFREGSGATSYLMSPTTLCFALPSQTATFGGPHIANHCAGAAFRTGCMSASVIFLHAGYWAYRYHLGRVHATVFGEGFRVAVCVAQSVIASCYRRLSLAFHLDRLL